jgi:phospholipid/cholesterol/gamma-HCH transport system permease protein
MRDPLDRFGIAPPVAVLGRGVLHGLEQTGRVILMLLAALRWLGRGRLEVRETVGQLVRIGVESVPLVMVTGLFSGMVLAYQTSRQLLTYGFGGLAGALVGLSMTREAAPVFTAISAAGRVGAGMAAEIGTMAVTEQVDALRVLATDPIRYLVLPRLVAAGIAMPGLTMLANIVGSLGGYFVAISLGITSGSYISSLQRMVWPYDVIVGLVKAGCFGVIIAAIGCFRGLHATGGADGVGRATTGAVVSTIVMILVVNLFLNLIFF